MRRKLGTGKKRKGESVGDERKREMEGVRKREWGERKKSRRRTQIKEHIGVALLTIPPLLTNILLLTMLLRNTDFSSPIQD